MAPRHPPYALSSLTIRKGLTLAGTRDWGLGTPKSPSPVVRASRWASIPPRFTHCNCGRNATVCRIFSCQRSLGELRSPNPSARSLVRPLCPTPRPRADSKIPIVRSGVSEGGVSEGAFSTVPVPSSHSASVTRQQVLLCNLVGLSRFELLTPRLSSVCSNQLSYRPTQAHAPIGPPRPALARFPQN